MHNTSVLASTHVGVPLQASSSESEVTRRSCQELCAWLVREYQSVEGALAIFDLDADGSLATNEFARVVEQAGIPPPAAQALLQSVGLGSKANRISIGALADRLQGRQHVRPVQGSAGTGVDAAARARSSLDACASASSGSPPPASSTAGSALGQRLVEASQQALQRHRAMKTELLDLLDAAKDSRPMAVRQEEVLRLLLDAQLTNVTDLQDPLGSSLLLLASRGGMDSLCKRLLSLECISLESRVAYANLPNDMGWTPLLLASQNGHTAICNILLLALADANAASRGTQLTPLMLAASNGHFDIVRLLLDPEWTRPRDTRADPWRMALDGRMALDFTRERLRVQRRLADDHKHDSQAAHSGVPDSYGVRAPPLAEAPEPYSGIERALLGMMHSGAQLSELHQDLLLGLSSAWSEPRGQRPASEHFNLSELRTLKTQVS